MSSNDAGPGSAIPLHTKIESAQKDIDIGISLDPEHNRTTPGQGQELHEVDSRSRLLSSKENRQREDRQSSVPANMGDFEKSVIPSAVGRGKSMVCAHRGIAMAQASKTFGGAVGAKRAHDHNGIPDEYFQPMMKCTMLKNPEKFQDAIDELRGTVEDIEEYHNARFEGLQDFVKATEARLGMVETNIEKVVRAGKADLIRIWELERKVGGLIHERESYARRLEEIERQQHTLMAMPKTAVEWDRETEDAEWTA